MLTVAKKYILAFDSRKEKEVVELIEKQGCFEIVDKEQGQAELNLEIQNNLQELDFLISSLKFSIGFLAPFAKKASLKDKLKKFNQPKIIIKEQALNNLAQRARVRSLAERIIAIEKERGGAVKEKKDKQAALSALSQLGNLQFAPQETESAFSLLVSFPQKQAEALSRFALTNGVFKQDLSYNSAKVVSVLLALKESRPAVEKFIKDSKGEILPYNFKRAPAQEKKLLNQEIAQAEKKLINLEKELKLLALNLKDLKIAFDVFSLEKTKAEIKKQVSSEGFLSYLVFWSQLTDKEKLEKKLKRISANSFLLESSLKKDETGPVVLNNSSAVRPFEYVTEIFGLPRGNEIDPTPYLAFFFILFFGICITDAGYGLLLALFSGLALLLFKERFGQNKLIKLLFYGGLSTFLVGVLFGSYFGASPSSIGLPFMTGFKLIDPIEDTVLFMVLAFALGYLQLILAQTVKMISGRRNNNQAMVLSGLAWTALYLFSGVLLLSIKLPYLKNIGIFATVLSLTALILTESKGVKVLLKPLAGGVKVLQGLIGAMSDILSYSRLMALGLATAVIALIVNQIAGLFSGLIPFVGWLLGGLILLGGHLFNLGINALSGFIHSGRLQFVEFFPKFLEGGGRRFKPVKSNLKYTKVEEQIY